MRKRHWRQVPDPTRLVPWVRLRHVGQSCWWRRRRRRRWRTPVLPSSVRVITIFITCSAPCLVFLVERWLSGIFILKPVPYGCDRPSMTLMTNFSLFDADCPPRIEAPRCTSTCLANKEPVEAGIIIKLAVSIDWCCFTLEHDGDPFSLCGVTFDGDAGFHRDHFSSVRAIAGWGTPAHLPINPLLWLGLEAPATYQV